MSHLSSTSTTGELSDRVVALLRTAIPALWGTVVAWALARLAGVLPTDLADTLGSALQSEAAVAFVVLAAITAWYALWRWAEPHVPAWLVRLALGSARTPVYAPQTPDGAHAITRVTPDPRIARFIDDEDDEDPGDVAGWPYPGHRPPSHGPRY